jgi:hypothetical protein
MNDSRIRIAAPKLTLLKFEPFAVRSGKVELHLRASALARKLPMFLGSRRTRDPL